jgi:hypothetical protein
MKWNCVSGCGAWWSHGGRFSNFYSRLLSVSVCAGHANAVLAGAVLAEMSVHDSAKKDDFAAMKIGCSGKGATLRRAALQSLAPVNRAVLASGRVTWQ